MMDDDAMLAKLARSTRSVSRASGATKVVCVMMLIAAGCTMLFALSRIDHGGDFVAFSLIGIVVGGLAMVFWSMAAFHGAVGESLALIASAHAKLDALAERGPSRRRREAAREVIALPPVTPPLSEGRSAEPLAAELDASAPPPQAGAIEPAATIAAASPVARAVEPAGDTRRCRHCAGEIPAAASRCRWCMRVT
jgi:hypothetical protein